MCVKCFIALTRRSAVRTIIEPNFPLNSLYLEKIVSKINSTTFYVARLNEHWAQNILTQVKHFIDQLFFSGNATQSFQIRACRRSTS